MFWKKEKEIILNCYTSRADVYNYYPVLEAKKNFPEWFKKLPTPVFKSSKDIGPIIGNVKQCEAFLDYYKRGFMLPLWSDLALTIGEKNSLNYKWQYSDRCSSLDIHSPKQTGDHFDPLLYQHLKLDSPWLMSCSEDISFLAVEPGWQFDVLKNIRILSGVVSFKYQSSTNINMFCLREEKETSILLEAGIPMYHYIPLTDRKITLKTHLISDEHYFKIKSIATPTKFVRHYSARKKILDTSGCPFQHETTIK